MGGGSKRRSAAGSAAAAAKRNRPPRPPPPKQQQLPQLTAEDLASLLRLVATALSLSSRFFSDYDLLHPSQTLALDASLSSAGAALTRLLSLLPPLDPPLSPPPSTHSSPWFPRFLSSAGDDDRLWREAFRMSKPSFDLLLLTLSPSLQSNPSNAVAANVPPDHKLGAALFRLAHAAPCRAVARLFGLPSTDASCRAFYEVCKAIAERLGHLFELGSDPKRVIEGFVRLSLPNCCGVLGFSRFSVDGEARGGAVIAQGLVDAEGRFLDVAAGWHGSVSPADIVESKPCKARDVVLGIGPSTELSGSVPRYLLGGSYCPLLPWLLTPFRRANSSSSYSKDEIFNNVHAQGMELVDRAFQGVRAQWQLLQTSWKEELAEALPYVVIAGCLLHNYLIKCGEPMPDENGATKREPEFPDFGGKGDEGGERIRELLASQLSLVSNKVAE